MHIEPATNFHAAGSGSGSHGSTTNPHTDDAATTPAVSSTGSPPGAAFRRAFQLACSSPAPSTASVMGSVSPSIKDVEPLRGRAVSDADRLSTPLRPRAVYPSATPACRLRRQASVLAAPPARVQA